jgi:hypothetical protein
MRRLLAILILMAAVALAAAEVLVLTGALGHWIERTSDVNPFGVLYVP